MKDVLITSSALIIALLILRRLFHKTLSRRVQYALWGLVLIRLLVPASLPAVDFSVLTAARPVEQAVTERIAERPVYVPVARAPRSEHPAAPDVSPERMEFSDADSVWVARDEDTAVRYRKLSMETLLSAVWKVGAALMGGFFVLSNTAFYGWLRTRREPFSSPEPVSRSVYIVPDDVLPSPCLFGGAIYLTPAAVASPEALRHVLAHEETHARHLDPLWALLRGVCLSVYWFDPLVWIAAACSKADSELACDEGALARLGEQERIPYGETLLSLIPVREGLGNPFTTATTMTAGKRQLRERITRIAHRPKQLAAAVAAMLVLVGIASACTFTGANKPAAEPDAGNAMEETAEFSFEQTTFRYGEHEYDMTLRSPSINSILSAVPVGDKIVVECHVGPHNGVYCIFDTASETFEKDIAGHHLIWHSDDITTAVYGFWSEIHTYDGSAIKKYDLADNEQIYDLEYTDNNTKLIVTIVRGDDAEQREILDLPSAGNPEAHAGTAGTADGLPYHQYGLGGLYTFPIQVSGGRDLTVALNSQRPRDNYFPVTQIWVYEGDRLLQIIETDSLPPEDFYAWEGLFVNRGYSIGEPDIRDLNFDGSEDFGLLAVDGYPHNVPYSYFLWNEAEERFDYAFTLFGSSDVLEVDAEKKQLIEHSHDIMGQYTTVFTYAPDGSLQKH